MSPWKRPHLLTDELSEVGQPPEPEPHPEAPESFLTSTFKALAERDYAWFFASNLAFSMAISMQFILYGFLAFDITGSAKALGAVAAGNAVPALLAAPFTGAIADRVHKRLILALSQAAAIGSSTTLGILVISSQVQLWHVVAVSMVLGLVLAFNMPTRQALVPQLVPRQKLMNAISLQMGQMNLSRIIAPAVAGLLVSPLGLGWVFIVSSGLFFGATLFEIQLPKHGMTGHEASSSFLAEVKDGFRYILRNKTLRLLLAANIFLPMFAFPVQQTLPVFAREVFDKGPAGLGLMAAMTGVGGLVGALIAANMDRQPKKGRLMFAGAAAMGAFYFAFALSPSFVVGLPLLAVAASGQMLFMTTNSTVIQGTISADMRGRVMAIMSMSIGLTPVGVVPVTIGVDEFGAPWSIAVTSLILLTLLALTFWRLPALRQMRLEAPKAVKLSPVQAAEMVADGRLSEAEAARLSGARDHEF